MRLASLLIWIIWIVKKICILRICVGLLHLPTFIPGSVKLEKWNSMPWRMHVKCMWACGLTHALLIIYDHDGYFSLLSLGEMEREQFILRNLLRLPASRVRISLTGISTLAVIGEWVMGEVSWILILKLL